MERSRRLALGGVFVAMVLVFAVACHGGEHAPLPSVPTNTTTTTASTTTTSLPEGTPTESPSGWLFCAMKAAGYTTMASGKVMNPIRYAAFPNGQPPCMDRYAINDGEMHFYWDFTVNDQGVLKIINDEYGTYWLRDRAIEWWAQTEGPKFLMYTPSAPHAPGSAPADAPPDPPPLPNPPNWREGCPGAFDEDASDKPAAIQERQCTASNPPPRDKYSKKSLWAADKAFGEIWDSIDQERTIFLVTSDNGMIQGAHKSKGKPTPYEEGLRVPMHLYVPGLPGGVIDRLTSNIDIMPTIIDLVRPGGMAEGFDVVLAITDDQPCIVDEGGFCDTVRQAMPWLSSTEGQPGWYSFRQFVTHTSLCCPGRAAILSGQTSPHNKQLGNSPLKFKLTEPIVFDGGSWGQLLEGDDAGWRSELYIMHGKDGAPEGYHGVREDCYVAAAESRPCLVYWERHASGEREMYDLANDPWQLVNLLANPVTGYPGQPGWEDDSPIVVDRFNRLAAHKASGN